MEDAVWFLTEGFLVEAGRGRSRLWGRWDRGFGCRLDDGTACEPRGPFLGRLGV